MSVTKLVLAASCCLLVGTAGAQITITAGDIPQTVGHFNQSKYLNNPPTVVDNGSSGGPHTWTFDTATYSGVVSTLTVVDKAMTPFAARFPDANLVTAESRGAGFTEYNYSKLDAGALLLDGFGDDNGGVTKAYVEVPPETSMKLPTTYGTSWQSGFAIHDTSGDTVFVLAYARRGSIDAWGTASTPAGSFDCLRENGVAVLTESVYIGGVPAIVETLPNRVYTWLAKGVGTVAMTGSMYGDTSLNFTQASLYVVHTGASGIAETPAAEVRAPIRGATIMSRLPAGAVAFDPLGRKVVNPRPGVFFVREPSAVTVRKVVLRQ